MGRDIGTYRSKRRATLSSIPVIVLTAVVSIACWVFGYQSSAGFPIDCPQDAMPLWKLVCSILPDKFFTYLIGAALICITAFLIQRGNYIFVIIKEKTPLPFILFFLFISTNPDFFPFRSTSIALLFLMASLFDLFSSYQDPYNVGKAFNSSVLLSIGSLFWVHLLWLLPIFWFGMYKFRSLSPRTFCASVLGFFTTYWFVLAWCVWQHDYSMLTVPYEQLSAINFAFIKNPKQMQWVHPVCVACLMIITSIYILIHEFENAIRTRQYLSFLLFFGIYSFLLLFLYEQDIADFASIFYVPASILIAYYFADRRGFLSFLFYILIVTFLVLLLLVRLWNFS